MKVSVFGLGYVGAVSCGCFANDGMEVIGVDVNPDKVALINAGRAPILEERIGEMISEAVAAGRLRATTDVAEAVLTTDLSVVSVGTPSNPAGSLNLAALERVSEQIGRAIAKKAARHTIVVRSTVMPRTVRDAGDPAAGAGLGQESRRGLRRLLQPRVPARSRARVHDYYNPPVHADRLRSSEADGESAAALYRRRRRRRCTSRSIETAEMVKYVATPSTR